MAVTLPSRSQTLNDYVLSVLWDTDGDPTDIITPSLPVWTRMIQSNGGMVDRRPPGNGPVEDVLYATPDIVQTLSHSRDGLSEDYVNIDVTTQAKYDWIQAMQFLMIPKFQLDNAKGPLAVADIVTRKRSALDKAMRNKLNYYLWNGMTSGSEKVFGLLDMIRTTAASADPSKGSIGGLAYNALNTLWQNKVAQFNAAYRVDSSAGFDLRVLSRGNNSLHGLYRSCSDNADMSEPDLLLVNSAFDNMWAEMIQTRQLFMNKDDRYNLGFETFFFKSAAVIWDSSMPVSSTSATYGEGRFVNSGSIKWTYADGLEKTWGDMEKVPGKAAYYWPCYVQFSITCDDLSKNGIIYDIKPST